MHLLALMTRHSTIRVEELAFLLVAVGGGLLFFGGTTPFARRGGQILGGLALAVAGVLGVIALHWGIGG